MNICGVESYVHARADPTYNEAQGEIQNEAF